MNINIIDFGAHKLPIRKHYNDAGADVFSPGTFTINTYMPLDIDLGFGLEIPDNWAGYIMARGSTGKRGLFPVSNPIDSGYRGSIHAVLWNISTEPITIMAGERIAQLVIMPCMLTTFSAIKPGDATETERGTGAYGSTGR